MFVAATILPAQSELVLAAMMVSGRFDTAMLLAVATAGNVLGSVVNWVLGRYFSHYRDRSWFPVSPESMVRAETWFARFGPAVLLLSWVPIIGDPLTVIAGVLKMRFLPFFAVVVIAKGGRYLFLAAATLSWLA
ncbi:YqaA family protein [Novosphingobium sp. CECT 9465]|uniref:YqaA family protein n=1 Tax=Novosphingobium sp. CECT 9465 TaxID=2829794 RepID=UPI001E59C39E|nr:YqaA family protein [Novosphingobium sp. CECT 9465]CAH0496038.1 Inner membrane protein YqaA [Novosphingobium sp. CECT 9465]